MWHIDVSIMSDDSLSWGISKGHIGEEKECVRLSFLIRSSSRKYKKREVVNTFKQIIIVKNNISWISLINEKWILNIDEMKEFFQKLPQLNWLKGKIFIKPEFEIGEEDETFGLYKKYETEIVFYITPDEIKSSYFEFDHPVARLNDLIDKGERVRTTAKTIGPGNPQKYSDRELFTEWETSCLAYLGTFKDKPYLKQFTTKVKNRLLPHVQRGLGILRSLKSDLEKGYLDDYISAEQQKVESKADIYVAEERINDLRSLQNPKYDPTKLIKLCEELNQNYKWKNYFAVGALLRTILDHIPPIFEKKTFGHVASEHTWGKSHKDLITRLYKSAKKIADNLLHAHIRKRESLPNKTRVNFTPELDILLGEILIKLKSCMNKEQESI